LAKALQDGGFSARLSRQHHHDESVEVADLAYAIFTGGRLVSRLQTTRRAMECSTFGATVLITEYPIWRQLSASAGRTAAITCKTFLVTEAPGKAISPAQTLGRISRAGEPVFIARKRQERRALLLLRTGGRPRLHDDARRLFGAVRRATHRFSVLPGAALPQYFAENHAIDFMVGFFGPFTAVGGRAFANFASRIRAEAFPNKIPM